MPGALDDGARPRREGVVAERVERNKAGVAAVTRCNGLAGKPTSIEDRDDVVRRERSIGILQNNVMDVDQAQEFGIDAGFLAHLTQSRGSCALAGLDVAARQAPQAGQAS